MRATWRSAVTVAAVLAAAVVLLAIVGILPGVAMALIYGGAASFKLGFLGAAVVAAGGGVILVLATTVSLARSTR